MDKFIISKNLLAYNMAKKVLLVECFIYGMVALLFLLVLKDTTSVVITAGLTLAMYFCYRNVQKGKDGGLNWAGLINGIPAFAALWYLWLARSVVTFKLVVLAVVLVVFAGAFIAVFARGMKAHSKIPTYIDIAKTLDIFELNTNQQKNDQTYSREAFRESVKNGTFEMELVYKDNDE
jgi:hypothetical protein